MHIDHMETPSVGANALGQPVLVFSAVAGYSAALRVRYLHAKPLSTRSSRPRHSRLDTRSPLSQDVGARGRRFTIAELPPPTKGEEARKNNIRSYRLVNTAVDDTNISGTQLSFSVDSANASSSRKLVPRLLPF